MATATITGTAVSAASGISLTTLRTYARYRMAGSAASADQTAQDVAINNAIKRIGKEDFYKFLRWGRINLVAKYTTGTVSISQNGSTLTGSGTAWSTAAVAAGDKIILAGNTNVELEVGSVGSETSITLKSGHKWLDTAVSGGSYTIYRDLYAVPSVSGLKFRKMYQPEGETWALQWVPPPDFAVFKMKSKNQSTSTPYLCTSADASLQIYPYPQEAAAVDFFYYAWPEVLSAGGDTVGIDDSFLPLLHRAIDLELALIPGVDLNPGEMEAIYHNFLSDFHKADRKEWSVKKVMNPAFAGDAVVRLPRSFLGYAETTIT